MEQRAEHQMTTLFKAWSELDTPPIIELLNIDKQLVGALYLDKMRYKNFVISNTNNSEKYYLFMDGVSVYFSFFQKITP